MIFMIPDYLNASNEEIIYASYIKRMIAFLIDYIILSLINLLYILFVMLFLYDFIGICDPYAIAYSILLPINILYFGYPESINMQATFGKKIVAIKVITVDNTKISFKKGIFRSILKLFSILSLIGISFIFINKKRQGLHDILAKTIVVENG